jgi:hypothetical protein
MKNKLRKFKIILSNENPFTPVKIQLGGALSEATIEAESEERIKEWFEEAKRENLPSVRGKRLYGIEEIKQKSQKSLRKSLHDLQSTRDKEPDLY